MQDLLVTWFGATGATVVRYAVALAVVIGLLLLLRWVLRNYATGGQLSIGRSRQSRLTVVEQVAVDQRRRLLLVRRDNVEHLILVGGGNDLVVEPTIIRGVPVGSLGRTARPAHPSPADEAETPAVATPTVAMTSAASAVEAPAIASRPAPVPRPAPAAEPTRSAFPSPSFPSHAAGEHPKATSIQARLNRTPPPRTPDSGRAAPASPYIPPEAHRVEPTVAPISPIVTDKSATDRPEPPAPQAERHYAEPTRAAPADEPTAAGDGPGFDDLARQLDEALKSEIEDMRTEATAQTVEPPVPVVAKPAPKVEPPKPAPSAASAWLRPRAPQAAAPAPRPFVPREPIAPRESTGNREPAAPSVQQRLRPAIPEPKAAEPAVEPEEAPMAAPEPALTQRAADMPADAPEDDGRSGADFSSLENEMARLLDELAGDSKGKR